jgi:hypothetical protein
MTQIAFKESLSTTITNLLTLAKEITYNNISDSCTFILSEIKNSDPISYEGQKTRILENNKKTHLDFEAVFISLEKMHPELYDINFYIHKSSKNLTIIDIRYYLKSSLGDELSLNAKDDEPMFHCKIYLPPYLSDKKEKFDINWEHQVIRTKWKLFWVKKKFENESRRV